MKCIIFSNGPVPTPEHPVVEGGGLRCWGLAQGLLANNPDLEITVAYHESHRKEQFTKLHEGIHIVTWAIDTIAELIANIDTVIVSYCMGDLSMKIAGTVSPNQQLILDCYVPIYTEVSARQSQNIDAEYQAFHADVGHWAYVLRRGDLFLCASEAQKQFYVGVLSAIGRLNPVTYSQDLFLIVPYGIYRQEPQVKTKPISRLIKDKKTKKVLWFGGIYPWFDLRNLIDAVSLLNCRLPTKLVIVGARNPFNSHPDFIARYKELTTYIDSQPGLKDCVILQDWVKFEDRADWYLDSDLVLVVNKQGEENRLAWRTRLIDFMWANLPIITNGGDPLGNWLIQQGAAARLSGLEVNDIANGIEELLKDTDRLQQMRHKLVAVKKDFYWDKVTTELSEAIASRTRAHDLEQYGIIDILPPGSGIRNKAKKILHKARLVPAYAKKYGVRNTYHAIQTTLNSQANLYMPLSYRAKNPRLIFIAHQLDMSGAPFVFIDLVENLIHAHPKVPIEFHTFNPSHRNNLRRLNQLGVKPKLHLSKDIGMDFNPGDIVVLNTVAHSVILRNAIYTALDKGTIKQLIWFIHEDEPELIFGQTERERLIKLIESNKLVIFAAAKKTVKHYQSFFKSVTNVRLQSYKIVIPQKYHHIYEAKDFDTIKFSLPGTMGDGRKGQLPIFYAFAAFLNTYYHKNPDRYRDFELSYIGISDDFLSRQVLKHAERIFGHRFKHAGSITHEEYLDRIVKCNITICYSLRECLPLFVFEGMIAGHPILRNDCSGMEEQLFVGKNGYYLESRDFQQVVKTIETVLHKAKTSNDSLSKMSAYSYKIAQQQEAKSYQPIIDQIIKNLG